MTDILKYLSPFLLVFIFIGCQDDTETSGETAQQAPQQKQMQQQPNQMGQMQQPSAANIDVSDEEAEAFVDAAVEAQEVQQKAQEKMVGIIEDKGLDVETFQKIAQSTQPNQPGQSNQQADVSEEQMRKYENASKALQEAQGEIQQDVFAAVKESGMEMQRFQEINQASQQDPELQQKLQQKMQEKMQDSQDGLQQPTGN